MNLVCKFRVSSVDYKKFRENLEMSVLEVSQTINTFFDNYEYYWVLAEDDCPSNKELLETLNINVGEFFQIVREKDMELMRFGQLIADAQAIIDENPESEQIAEIIELASIKEKLLREQIERIDQIKIEINEKR